MTEPTQDAAPVHVLEATGDGYFSTGWCTGCKWEMKGHRADIERVYETYHRDGAQVLDLPPRVEIPGPTGDEHVSRLEMMIVHLLVHHVDHKDEKSLFVALGVAHARKIYIAAGEPTWAAEMAVPGPNEYISVMTARIATLHPRQREKLRHPSRDRREMQRILEGENL